MSVAWRRHMTGWLASIVRNWKLATWGIWRNRCLLLLREVTGRMVALGGQLGHGVAASVGNLHLPGNDSSWEETCR